MSEQLDRKEYILQTLELKVYHYEKYLQRKSLLEAEARKLLNKFQLDDNLKDQRVSNVVEDNLALRDEMKDAFKEVNKLERQNIKKKQVIFELKEKVEQLKKKNLEVTEKAKKEKFTIKMANFDSEAQYDLARKESVNTAQSKEDDYKPVELGKLSKMAEQFPRDYASKLEVHLMQAEQYIEKTNIDNRNLTHENNLLKEELEQNKFLVQ